jgi:hypothetical protein
MMVIGKHESDTRARDAYKANEWPRWNNGCGEGSVFKFRPFLKLFFCLSYLYPHSLRL